MDFGATTRNFDNDKISSFIDDRSDAYERIKVLGRGAYGEATLVLRKEDKRQFVIKEVRATNMSEEELRKAQQEAEVLRKMAHSNIICCIESFVTAGDREGEMGKYCIVTEFADRGDLSQHIKAQKKDRGFFEEREVMSIFVQLCRAIKHVHKLNILHRDLKSQNVFLATCPDRCSSGEDGELVMVKLGDFGIAKVMSNTLSMAETQIGTPYYLSPEIYEDQAYGKKSDMWSMGILLHEVAALELPFQAKNLIALSRKVLVDAPNRLPIDELNGKNVYSDEVQELVDSLLNKDPNLRPSAEEVLRDSKAVSRFTDLGEDDLSYTLMTQQLNIPKNIPKNVKPRTPPRPLNETKYDDEYTEAMDVNAHNVQSIVHEEEERWKAEDGYQEHSQNSRSTEDSERKWDRREEQEEHRARITNHKKVDLWNDESSRNNRGGGAGSGVGGGGYARIEDVNGGGRRRRNQWSQSKEPNNKSLNEFKSQFSEAPKVGARNASNKQVVSTYQRRGRDGPNRETEIRSRGSDGRYHGSEVDTIKDYQDNRKAALVFKERYENQNQFNYLDHNRGYSGKGYKGGGGGGEIVTSSANRGNRGSGDRNRSVEDYGSIGAEFHALKAMEAQQQGKMMSIARQDFLANREARKLAKARAEEDLYGKKQLVFDDTHDDEGMHTRQDEGFEHGTDRREAVLARGEYERERKRLEHESMLQEAADAHKRDMRMMEERRKQYEEQVVEKPSSNAGNAKEAVRIEIDWRTIDSHLPKEDEADREKERLEKIERDRKHNWNAPVLSSQRRGDTGVSPIKSSRGARRHPNNSQHNQGNASVTPSSIVPKRGRRIRKKWEVGVTNTDSQNDTKNNYEEEYVERVSERISGNTGDNTAGNTVVGSSNSISNSVSPGKDYVKDGSDRLSSARLRPKTAEEESRHKSIEQILEQVDDVRTSFSNIRPYSHIVPPKPMTEFNTSPVGVSSPAARAASYDYLSESKEKETTQEDLTLSMVKELAASGQSTCSQEGI